MSRVAKNPIAIPKSVEIKLEGNQITVKGSKGVLTANIHPSVKLELGPEAIRVIPDKSNKIVNSLAGTTRANIYNMVTGVNTGYERKLTLVGVGYRAQGKGNSVSLSLGFSHPVEYQAPDGVVIETPTQTEIVVKGIDKQVVGQVAANIRSYRPPEPYKGKGVRYFDEEIIRKEAKKK
ncbi:50S ribosomal protein L6 [Methylococcales bacterium]|nr:50S ribosomal protein L6 [Methylococcales bacterium]